MYASKRPRDIRREQPVSVSPDPSKSAWAIIQPPSTHTHQRGKQRIVVGANVLALDADAKAQGDENSGQRSNGHAGDECLALPAFGQVHAGRDLWSPFYGSIGRHPVRWEAESGCWMVDMCMYV